MINLKGYSKLVKTCLSILVLFSFFYSFITGEDSLGGAEHDYIQNNIFLQSFTENFSLAIQNYGISGHEVRNLPVFNIILAQFVNLGFEISNLKYLNLLVLTLIIIFFLKSIKVEYRYLSLETKIIFSSLILLSPTIRSLVNYPFPFLWAICFFIISIFFYLNFKNYKLNKLKNALYCVLYLSLASYMTPNFCVFLIIYLSKFFIEYKFSKKFFQICGFSIILSLPALSFLIWKDFYIFKNEVFEVTFFEKFNISNKILIISSFVFLFFIPNLTKTDLKKLSLTSITQENKIYIILFFLLSIIFFDFKIGAGGGIFYQFSQLLLNNNIFLFFVFFVSLFIFDLSKLYNFENFLIFFVLVLYNPQYTIYYKYFDPLLLFVFLFLVKIKKGNDLNLNNLSKKYFIFYVFFLLLNIFKDDLRLLLV